MLLLIFAYFLGWVQAFLEKKTCFLVGKIERVFGEKQIMSFPLGFLRLASMHSHRRVDMHSYLGSNSF